MEKIIRYGTLELNKLVEGWMLMGEHTDGILMALAYIEEVEEGYDPNEHAIELSEEHGFVLVIDDEV